MSVTSGSASVWKVVSYNTNVEVREDPDDASSEQKRDHHVLQRKREHEAVTNFANEVGNTDTLLQFSNGGVTLTTAPGDTYVHVTHSLGPSTEGSDLWTEEMVSEYFEAWVAMPAGWINS